MLLAEISTKTKFQQAVSLCASQLQWEYITTRYGTVDFTFTASLGGIV